jgi:hyaluronan synthase
MCALRVSWLQSDLVASKRGSNFQFFASPQMGKAFERVYHQVAAYMGIALIISTLAAVILTNFNYLEQLDLARERLRHNPWGNFFWIAGLFFGLVSAAALVWRIVLFIRYRPAPACGDESLPVCTVVVPAYNEGRQVLDTLLSLAGSDYPRDKLQLIAVDDGSLDDTWRWISRARKELKGRVVAIRMNRNQGKRHALYAGFRKSKGDILVTVDSDSMVDRETLRRLVSPFMASDRVGAVAGNVRVLNLREGIIPRMLEVTFHYSFDFIRAGQSMVNTVFCTPGALSAYRRSILMPLLDEWVNQRFLGRPANIGEDRAMTNLILRQGYYVHFQQDACVYTKVPVRYPNLCRMFLRWARSNVRETLVMSGFAFRRFRNGPMLGARINLLLGWVSMTVSQVFLGFAFVMLLIHPMMWGLQTLTGVFMMSSLPAAFYCWRRRSTDGLWAYSYGFFWFALLSWIAPYSLVTVYKSGWLTRQVKRGAMGAGTGRRFRRHSMGVRRNGALPVTG